MIISASRRTDIPAYYSQWLMNRIRTGYCLVPNPFNKQQIARVSLSPCDVDAFVFWTRDARPMMKHLAELDRMGYRYLFLVTVVDYPRAIGPGDLPVGLATSMFRQLADVIGSERVVWRYDPLIFSNVTDVDFHLARFSSLAHALHGSTKRVIVSGLTIYAKNMRSIAELAKAGVAVQPKETLSLSDQERLLQGMLNIAKDHGLELVSCAETMDWWRFGVKPGRCIDNELIQRLFKIEVASRKDPGQRPACRCVISRDIGVYNTCIRGCPYCYAVSDPAEARRNFNRHDPAGPSLLPLPLA